MFPTVAREPTCNRGLFYTICPPAGGRWARRFASWVDWGFETLARSASSILRVRAPPGLLSGGEPLYTRRSWRRREPRAPSRDASQARKTQALRAVADGGMHREVQEAEDDIACDKPHLNFDLVYRCRIGDAQPSGDALALHDLGALGWRENHGGCQKT